MKPLLLLILDLPDGVSPAARDGLPHAGGWTCPPGEGDAALAEVLTGVPAAMHGVLNEWELTPDGQQLRRAARHRLMQPPLWERVEGAVAVGAPWSTGSVRGRCVVSPDFPRHARPGPFAPLPGRVWPEAAAPALSDLCLHGTELDPATVAGLGFALDNSQVGVELAAWLSLHAIATAQLEGADAPLGVVRLPLRLRSAEPATTTRFIDALVARYQALSDGRDMLLLTRQHTGAGSHDTLYGPIAGEMIATPLALGQALARRFGLPDDGRTLDPEHWSTLRLAHQPPNSVMPGLQQTIAALCAQVEAGCERMLEVAGD